MPCSAAPRVRRGIGIGRPARLVVGAVVMVMLGYASQSAATVDAGLAARPPADPAAVPGWDADPWSILGPTRIDASVLADFVRARAPRATVPIDELARIFVEEGAALGVRADLAWAQSIVETGSFHFPDRGMVHPADNNFAGIGACDSCRRGHGYPSARAGVRAQMELLRGYADPTRLVAASIHPPHAYLGIAPTWWQMGNGRWATAPNYAAAVTATYRRIVAFAQGEPMPDGRAAATAGPQYRARRPVATTAAPIPPAPHSGDGLFLLDPTGQVHDVGDARFWGSAVGALGSARAVAIATTPHALGYWIVNSDGTVLPFGSAPDFGPAPRGTVAAAPVRTGVGYFTTDREGRVAAFGAARLPVAPVVHRPGPAEPSHVVAIAASRSGNGYWLLDADGALRAAGDATAFVSPLRAPPTDPAVALATTPWDDGGWITTASGRVVAFGAARAHGGLTDALGPAAVASHLVVGLVAAPSGDGYWIVTADGMVLGCGNAATFPVTTTNGVPILAATGRLDAAAATRSVGRPRR